MSRRTNIYIDGFNLYFECLKKTTYKWLDIAALCNRLLNTSNSIVAYTEIGAFSTAAEIVNLAKTDLLETLHPIDNGLCAYYCVSRICLLAGSSASLS